MRLCQWLPLHGGQLFLLSIIGSAFVWHDVDYDSEQKHPRETAGRGASSPRSRTRL